MIRLSLIIDLFKFKQEMGSNLSSKNIENVAFNRYEIHVIRDTWASLNKIGLPELGLGLMTRILIEHKEMKSMWRKQNVIENDSCLMQNYCNELMNPNHLIKAHGEKVFNTIRIAVNTIDDLSSLYHFLKQMGYDHYQYGTRDKHFEIIGESLISTLSEALKEKWTEKTKKAWIKLFQIIEYQMKSGMEKAKKEEKLSLT